MATNDTPPRPSMMRFASVGVEFVSTILGGIVAGYYVGRYFNSAWIGPVFLIGGVFLAFYRLILELREFTQANKGL